MSKNIACAWGKLFEPFARAYLEWEHHTQVFGYDISLNLAKDHPLYGKVTCSPDGYFKALDGSIVLLEFKCPFKRKIAVFKTPTQYRDQIQTGLSLSGESVTKGLFVDACFRMCGLNQLGINLLHNASPHGGVVQNQDTLPPSLRHLHSRKPAKDNTQSSSSFEPWNHDIASNVCKGHARYLIGCYPTKLLQSASGF